MTKIIKEVDWNGNHYVFSNEYKDTGFKSHDRLIMRDKNGYEWTGETTWINRPWHRFDLEEALVEVISKAFGDKAHKLIQEINKNSSGIDQSINEFFKRFKPEDIETEIDTIETEEVDKQEALADYLEVDVEEVEYDGGNDFIVDGDRYMVLTDDEADEEFENYCRSLWEDIGLEIGGSIAEQILENAIDPNELEDYVREDIENYVYEDLTDDEVIEECIDEDILIPEDVYDENDEIRDDIDIDGLREDLIEKKFEDVDDYVEYCRDMGYDNEFFSNYIDDDEAVQIIMDAEDVNGDGRGAISSYDGREIDLENGLFVYRID